MHVLHHNLNLVSNVLEEQYVRLKADLNQWRVETVDKIEAIYRKTLINLDTSYERLNNFRRTLDVLLDEEHLLDQHLSITSSDLLTTSARLSWIEDEINWIRTVTYTIDLDPVTNIDRPCLIRIPVPVNSSVDSQPCRVLLKREQVDQLSEIVDRSNYTLLTHNTSPEAILTTANLQQLATLIEHILSDNNEIRILIQEVYAPLIIGQLGSRARMLKDKYDLHSIKIYPTCAPLSTERILLLSATENEQIFQCLKEIYWNLFDTTAVDINQQAIFLYSPEYYDISLVEDYGGFIDQQLKTIPRISSDGTTFNDDDELSDYQDEDVEDFDHETNSGSTDNIEPLRERHWTLSDAQAGALFGPNCSRLHQIRSESNAWIVIYEAEGKNSRRPMSIRGTKSEIEHATKLILETIKRHDRKLPLKQNHKRTK